MGRWLNQQQAVVPKTRWQALQQTLSPKNKFMTGAWYQKVFDPLLAGQYAIAGLGREALGMSDAGAIEGIKNRATWVDIVQEKFPYEPSENWKKNFWQELKRVTPGVLGDVFLDPLWLLPPVKIAKMLGITKVAKVVSKTRPMAWIGEKVGQALVTRYGQPGDYVYLAQKTVRNIAMREERALAIGRPILGLTNAEQQRVAQLIKGGISVSEIERPLRGVTEPAVREYQRLGKRAIELGLLDEETFYDNFGRYMPRLYRTKEMPEGTIRFFGDRKPIRVNLDRFRKKQDIPEDIRMAMGEIKEAGYPTSKGLAQLGQAVERTRFFKEVAQKYAKAEPFKNWMQLPTTKALGELGGLDPVILKERDKMFQQLAELRQVIKSPLRELKQVKKIDRQTQTLIDRVGREMEQTEKLFGEEFAKFFRVEEPIIKVIKPVKRITTLPDPLIGIAQDIRKYKTFEALQKSKDFIKLERVEVSGLLERNGFPTIESFWKAVKEPYLFKPEKVVQAKIGENINKLIKITKREERLTLQKDILENINKASFEDRIKFLQNTIQDIVGQRTLIRQQIAKLRPALSGKYVSPVIYQDIQQMIRVASKGERTYRTGIGLWKWAKVIANPATHLRNMYSNVILADLGGLSPLRIDIWAEALSDLAHRGKYYKELKKNSNILYETFYGREIGDMLTALEKAEGTNMFMKMRNAMKFITQKTGNVYQAEEQWSKMALYIFYRKKGWEPLKAAKEAEKWLFNYREVPYFIDVLRGSRIGGGLGALASGAYPFITFSYKAVPRIIEKAWKNTPQLTKWMKMYRGIEQFADEETLEKQKELLPDYMREGMYLRLPFQDEAGREQYLDLNFILPWGDIGEVGRTLTPNHPFWATLYSLFLNKHPLGWDIVKPGSTKQEARESITDYIYKAVMPSLAPEIPGVTRGGYSYDRLVSAFKGELDYMEKARSVKAAIWSSIFGIKTIPVDVMEAKQRKESETDRKIRNIQSRIRNLYRLEKRKIINHDEFLKKEKEYQKKIKELGGKIYTPSDRWLKDNIQKSKQPTGRWMRQQERY